MKITAWPCSFSRVEHLRQLCDALRGEHRGRLVEDQHPRASPQRLDDLHLLLVAKGEVDCVCVGVDLDAEQPGELGEALPRAFLVQPQPPRVAQHQVLEDGQRRNQRRVLRDGADAQLERGAGRRDHRLDPLDPDRARVGAVQAGEDADQSGLASAVLAEQAVHLTAAEGQVDAVVREHTRERLRDPLELDDRRVGRFAHPGRLSVLEETPWGQDAPVPKAVSIRPRRSFPPRAPRRCRTT